MTTLPPNQQDPPSTGACGTAPSATEGTSKPSTPRAKGAKSPRTGTIPRDASASQKGPRLQRLRAAHFIFNAIADSTVRYCYAAVEVDGDASVRAARPEGSDTYSEEDKAYLASNSLSFVTDAVLNTMVIFVDQWLDSGQAKNVRFGFFTPASVAAEVTSDRTKRLSINPPKTGILKQLVEGKTGDAEVIKCVRTIFLDEYAAQYQDHEPKGHYAKIQAWTDENWSTFLSLINWQFSAPDHYECEATLLKDVKACRFYKTCHQDREKVIVSALVDLLDSKQHLSDPLDRHVSGAEVENIFLKLQHEPDIRPTDATWKSWAQLPAPTDQRSLMDKFRQACSNLTRATLDRYQRQAADALLEFEAHSQDKNVLAMRYQIFDACEGALAHLLTTTDVLSSEAELVTFVDALVCTAVQRVEARSKDYAYKVTNPAFVRNIVYSLFQECYLSFQSVDAQENT